MIELLHENRNYTRFEHLKPVLKGSFEYLTKENAIYSEETFYIYKNAREGILILESEMLTRLDSGEILKILTHYKLNKDYVPEVVSVDKMMGKQVVSESFKMNPKSNIITYHFQRGDIFNEYKITPPPRFQISTPSNITTTIFLFTKKYDPTGKNVTSVLMSENFWEYHSIPALHYIYAERQTSRQQAIKIKGKELRTYHYKLYLDENHAKINEIPADVYLSNHYGIPYLVEYQHVRIQIKFLTEIEGSDIDNDLTP